MEALCRQPTCLPAGPQAAAPCMFCAGSVPHPCCQPVHLSPWAQRHKCAPVHLYAQTGMSATSAPAQAPASKGVLQPCQGQPREQSPHCAIAHPPMLTRRSAYASQSPSGVLPRRCYLLPCSISSLGLRPPSPQGPLQSVSRWSTTGAAMQPHTPGHPFTHLHATRKWASTGAVRQRARPGCLAGLGLVQQRAQHPKPLPHFKRHRAGRARRAGRLAGCGSRAAGSLFGAGCVQGLGRRLGWDIEVLLGWSAAPRQGGDPGAPGRCRTV